MIAVRPWSFPASAMPVIVTLAYLYWLGLNINWLHGIWALLNIVVFQATGNTWSDYYDYLRKVDADDTYGVRILTDGIFTPKEIYRLSLCLLVVASASGFILLLRTGLPLLYIGLGGIACSLFYPPLKFRALGDFVIFICYALLPPLGTAYVATGEILWSVLWLSLPIGLITVAILHINNLRDIATDARAHIRTIAMLLGVKSSVFLYAFEVLCPFVLVVAGAWFGIFPWWSLLTLVASVLAIANVRAVFRLPKQGIEAVAHVDERTAQLQLLFSLLFAVSLIIDGWCHV